MDPLSQILQTVRARAPLIADLRLGGDVSIGLPTLGGLPFHYIVQGSCRVDTGSEWAELGAGDFVMLARLPCYRLETGRGVHRAEIMDFAERDNFSVNDLRVGRNHSLTTQIGDGPPQARVLSAILMPGGASIGALARDLPVVTLLRDVQAMLEPWLVAAIDFMSNDVCEPAPGLGAIAERLVEVIFLAVLRGWLLDGTHARGWMRGMADPRIARVLNAMHAMPAQRWTLRDLALACGCSRSGLAKRFRAIMDETPFAYLTRWRMHLAAAALAEERLSISEIGMRFGYTSSQAFAHAFHTAFDETPATYRRRRRAEPAAMRQLARPTAPGT
jgi:AraC-like DNA-binding protein